MGDCGISQPAARSTVLEVINTLFRFGFDSENIAAHGEMRTSHEYCNHFYNSAFENDFIASNLNQCKDTIDISTLPQNFKMGYMEKRRS